jgi:catechol-2,3-dioxygenase
MQTLTPKTTTTPATITTTTPVIDRATLPRQISYLVLNVTDMAKALDFYKNTLGLAVSHESANWCELSMGVTLALKLADASCATSAKTNTNVSNTNISNTNISNTNIEMGHRTGLVFNVVNAQKSYDTMKALGIKLQGEPIQGCSEGTLKFSFEDPFGNTFSAYGAK